MDLNIAKRIENSDVYLVVLSKEYIDDLDCLEQDLYANSLKKPIVIIRIHNVDVPNRLKNENLRKVIDDFDGNLLKSNELITTLKTIIKERENKNE